jgi:hypothetical protein
MHIAMNEESNEYTIGFVFPMNESLTIDDDDEEDHSRFFSCPDPVDIAQYGVPTNGHILFWLDPVQIIYYRYITRKSRNVFLFLETAMNAG